MTINIVENKEVFREAWLAALADPTRRQIVEMLSRGPRTAGELHRAFPIADPAVSRHLRVLRQVGLVSERRLTEDRRVRLYVLEPEPLDELSHWLASVSRMWQAQLESFKDYVALRKAEPPKDER